MSNKRIDLTQLEGITTGKWSIIRNGGRIDIGVGTPDSYSPIITFTESLAKQVMMIDRDVADMNAIAAVPELIAELKRCYEKEDETIEYVDYLLATPDVLERLMGSPSQIHTINNLTASLEKLLDILKN